MYLPLAQVALPRSVIRGAPCQECFAGGISHVLQPKAKAAFWCRHPPSPAPEWSATTIPACPAKNVQGRRHFFPLPQALIAQVTLLPFPQRSCTANSLVPSTTASSLPVHLLIQTVSKASLSQVLGPINDCSDIIQVIWLKDSGGWWGNWRGKTRSLTIFITRFIDKSWVIRKSSVNFGYFSCERWIKFASSFHTFQSTKLIWNTVLEGRQAFSLELREIDIGEW